MISKTNIKNKGSALAWVIVVIAIVIIAGGIYFYSQPKQSAVAPRQNQSVTSTDMTIWKTYTNSQYGFSIQYPVGTGIDETTISGGTSTSFVVSPTEKIDVNIVSNPIIVHDLAWGDISQSPNCDDTADGAEVSDMTIDGVDFEGMYLGKDLSAEYDSSIDANEYCAIINGTAYKLIPEISEGTSTWTEVESDPVLNDILSSFKFTVATTSTNSINWQTYTNSQYGFTLRIPPDWQTIDLGGGHISFGTSQEIAAQIGKSYEVLFEPGDQSATISAQGGKIVGAYSTDARQSWEVSQDPSGPQGNLLVYTIYNVGDTLNFFVHASDEDLLREVLSTFKFTN